jgi:hypothetical protein
MLVFEEAWADVISICRVHKGLHDQMSGALKTYDKKPESSTPINYKAVTATIKEIGKTAPLLLPRGTSIPHCLLPPEGVNWNDYKSICAPGLKKLGDPILEHTAVLNECVYAEEEARLAARDAIKVYNKLKTPDTKAMKKAAVARYLQCHSQTEATYERVSGYEDALGKVYGIWVNKVCTPAEKEAVREVRSALKLREEVNSTLDKKKLTCDHDPVSDDDEDEPPAKGRGHSRSQSPREDDGGGKPSAQPRTLDKALRAVEDNDSVETASIPEPKGPVPAAASLKNKSKTSKSKTSSMKAPPANPLTENSSSRKRQRQV